MTEEKDKFTAYGLDIESHRAKMNEITPEGKDIEDRFKDPDDSLQLVFVCAMWLTGFDVPNLSTLYLDKPMKGHTLMQAIARANRVYPDKPCGIIVDYVNIFKFMKTALSQYATGDDSDEFPAKDVTQLIAYTDATIEETDSYFKPFWRFSSSTFFRVARPSSEIWLKGARQGPTGYPTRLVAILMMVLGFPSFSTSPRESTLSCQYCAFSRSPAAKQL